jgi:hypothetical protein
MLGSQASTLNLNLPWESIPIAQGLREHFQNVLEIFCNFQIIFLIFYMNFLQISYNFFTNFLQISYKFLTNFLQISYKFLMNF